MGDPWTSDAAASAGRVDVDARSEAAVVPAKAVHGWARTYHPEVLAGRDVEEAGGSLAVRRDQPVDDRRESVGRDPEALVPCGEAVGEGLRTGEERVERRRRLVEPGVLAAHRPPGEGALELVLVRTYDAGEGAGVRREGDELGVEPVAAVALRDLVGQARPEGFGVVGEGGRRSERLDVDAGLQVGRAEVRVDRWVCWSGGGRGGGSRGRPDPGRDLRPRRLRGSAASVV